jgi:hypothetical protein
MRHEATNARVSRLDERVVDARFAEWHGCCTVRARDRARTDVAATGGIDLIGATSSRTFRIMLRGDMLGIGCLSRHQPFIALAGEHSP